MWEKGLDASRYAQLRAAMLWYLKDVIEVMDKSGLILTREQAERIQESGHNFLTLYQKLAELAFAAGICSYKLRPKLHYFEPPRASPAWPPAARAGGGGGSGVK